MTTRYWDSDACLGFLSEEADKIDECRAVLDLAFAGKTQIVTSALTMTEVLWVKGHDRISKESAEKVHAFYERSCFVIVDLDRAIAEKARQVVWDYSVKPKDSIHIATAIDVGIVDVMETFDEHLIKRTGQIGDPVLEIRRPLEQATLFSPEAPEAS